MPPSRLRSSSALCLSFLYPSLRPLSTVLPTSTRLPEAISLSHCQSRSASHATQGRANKAAQGPGKRLGLKRAATELVVPGTIIFRQRGTRWFPGENVGMGRDHTIYAKEKGYVVYYKDKWKGLGYGGAGRVRGVDENGVINRGSGGWHFKKYIGIVFNKGDTLPRPEGRAKDRRLKMVTKPRKDLSLPLPQVDSKEQTEQQDISGLTPSSAAGTIVSVTKEQRAAQPPRFAKGYQIRESNVSIGRAVDKAGLRVRKFKRGDRWLAWRKRAKRVQASKQLKAQKKARKGKGAAKRAASGDTRNA